MSDREAMSDRDRCTEPMIRREDGSWYCPKCGQETSIKTKPTRSRLATLEAENDRLASLVERLKPVLQSVASGDKQMLLMASHVQLMVRPEMGYVAGVSKAEAAALLAAIGEPNTTAGQSGESR